MLNYCSRRSAAPAKAEIVKEEGAVDDGGERLEERRRARVAEQGPQERNEPRLEARNGLVVSPQAVVGEPEAIQMASLTVAILERGSVLLKQFAAAKTVMLNVVDVFKGETRDEALQNKKDGSSTSESGAALQRRTLLRARS